MYKHLSAPTLPEASQTVTKAEQIGPYDLRETLGVGAYAVYVDWINKYTLTFVQRLTHNDIELYCVTLKLLFIHTFSRHLNQVSA